jgi:Rps23 Pro-64 3,4-dihydroxylase Tpa1-like proline 4-hydroxylase
MNISMKSDVLDTPEWRYIVEKTFNGTGWSFTGFSNDSASKFWYMNLDNDPFFTDLMMKKINSLLVPQFTLDRVYANGQTHGLSGDLHQDVVGGDGKYYTFLYYANPEWDPTWGGYTVFYNRDSTVIHSQYPRPNSAVLFDSSIWHAGLEPTRHCKDLRVTIAWKLRLKDE